MEEEFDFNLDSDIGTSVAALKNNNKPDTETDIDYDDILNNLNSETNNKPKIQETKINMNQFARKIENKLDNNNFEKDIFVKKRDNEIRIVRENLTDVKQEIESLNLKINNKPKNLDVKNVEIKELTTKDKLIEMYKKFEYNDILLYILFFLVLNSKFIIEIIYDKITSTRDNPYLNLIVRGMLFGLAQYMVKKFNLLPNNI
jgi:hypothetical protein